MAHEAKARKRMMLPAPDYPSRIEPGTVLYRIRVESPCEGFEVIVKRGRRRNRIVVESFGRKSGEHGFDWLCRHLRQRLVVRELGG